MSSHLGFEPLPLTEDGVKSPPPPKCTSLEILMVLWATFHTSVSNPTSFDKLRFWSTLMGEGDEIHPKPDKTRRNQPMTTSVSSTKRSSAEHYLRQGHAPALWTL